MHVEKKDTIPEIKYCTFCGSKELKILNKVPRCGSCKAVFFAQFSRFTRAKTLPIQSLNSTSENMRAVLSYEQSGYKGICGQTVGADSSSEHCVIYTGNKEFIYEAAKELLKDLERQKRLVKYILVFDEPRIFGSGAVTEINLDR